MDVLAIVKKNNTFLKERFGVKKIGVFGSMVRGDAKNKSDVDIPVDFKSTKKSYDNFTELDFTGKFKSRGIHWKLSQKIPAIQFRVIENDIRKR